MRFLRKVGLDNFEEVTRQTGKLYKELSEYEKVGGLI